MEAIVPTVLQDIYKSLQFRDPRTKDFLFLDGPSYMAMLLLGYLYVVKVWGPRYMQPRKPYDLKRVILFYNAFQVVANVYFVTTILYYAFWGLSYSPICQGTSYSDDARTMNLLRTLHGYLFVRIIDFLDTIFFVMKKKFSHVSNLHVIHHTIVVFNGWMFLRIGADGQGVLGVAVNSMVHVLMYTYYFLSAFGPAVQKYLWWKKYLTRIQIGQFFWMIFHVCIPIFKECGMPIVPFVYVALPQVILILALFVNFYVHSYVMRTKKDDVTNSCFMQASKCNGTVMHANGFAVKKHT
ncbi:very long chain fatty acid elongase 7-like [Ornithodoros turicata]|uniref:very long chain fatty acid elongase 7-like n=1 Tax=Ornithodoros turicata TaxID=34597 RepID=UPI00313A041D